MTDEKFNKRIIVEISSSDESKSLPSESDLPVAEVISSFTCCNDDDDDDDDDDDGSQCYYSEDEDKAEVGGDEDWNTNVVDKPDVESMYNKVIQYIRGRSDLQELRLDECKVYLRTHNLRLAGTKEECIERIEEHWKLKDGSGEVLYPRTSFIIDCTGDVCRGDIVLFHQKVPQMSGKMARNRTAARRTVAGRVIKESYGATRQQHTFTVEVLWSRGAKKLDPLFPLLVKGRNLYRMKTFRQLWKNEKERLEVLSEKHRRGDAARAVRATRRTKAVMGKNEPLAFKGPSRTRETSHGKKKRCNEHGELVKSKEMIISHCFAPYSSKPYAGSRGSAPHRRHYYSPNQGTQSPSPSNHKTFFPTEAHNFHSHGGFASVAGSPYSYTSYSHFQNENEAASFNYPSHQSSTSTSEKRQKRR